MSNATSWVVGQVGAWILAAAAVGCTSGGSSSSSDGSAGACVPGQSVGCVGPGACTGYQVCAASGQSFEPCICGSPSDGGSEASAQDGSATTESGVDAAQVIDATTDHTAPGLDASHDGAGDADADATVNPPLDASADAPEARPPIDSGNPLDGALFCSPSPRCQGTGNAGTCFSQSDPSEGCGTGSRCAQQNALTGCDAGACVVLSCNPGFADCDGNPANGCEADLSNVATCTACNVACAAGEQCISTGCVATCASPNVNCAGTCRDLSSDFHACGSCNTACNAGQVCQSGTCVCAAGYTLCGQNCVDTSSSATACGPGCQNCSPGVGLQQPLGTVGGECVAGSCVPLCAAPYTRCGFACTELATDATNCGACGVSCGSGQICADGSCAPLTMIQWVAGVSPSLITQDATNVYYADDGDDTINLVPKATGQRTMLASAHATSLAVDSAYVYWVDATSGMVSRVPIAGGAVTPFVDVGGAPIVADAAGVHWIGSGGVVWTAPASGATPTMLVTFQGLQGPLVTDGTNLYVLFQQLVMSTTLDKGVLAIHPDGTTAKVNDTEGVGTYTMVAASAANPETIDWLFTFAGVGTYLGADPGAAPINGDPNAVPTPWAGGPSGGQAPLPSDMASDGCLGIYYTAGGPDVWFAHDTTVSRFVSGGHQTQHVVVDSNYVYWTDSGGWVGRMAKY